MKRLLEMIQYLIKGMSRAVLRFPLTVTSLFGATVLICYMISLHESPPLVIEKIMFTLLVSAFLGMVAQFATERFKKLSKIRLIVYGIAVLFTVGYFSILWPVPEISPEIVVRTFVTVFAMLCAVLWIPSFKEKKDFNQVALIHFKTVFTSVLYSGVLSGGIAAIITAIDILLFRVNNDAYSYMMIFVWIMFAPLYYLSLLPKFNSEEESDLKVLQTMRNYPRFLEILISYIAIPLVATYTLVLLAYFIKILVTLHWPSGQLGPMVLVYSAAGLLIFILASLLENRFAVLYRNIFPKVLIPVVIMQLISVGIRLNAYGVTESRYYVALFGVFSIVIGVMLSIKPISKNRYIVLLAALFAIFSIIPPGDAFTVSRVSQVNRVEQILQAEGILFEGKLTPKTNVSEFTKTETTNILSYLERQSTLKYINWLPEDFNLYRDMESVLGFEPTYPNYVDENARYFYAGLDAQKPISISGYDIFINVFSERYMKDQGTKSYYFTLKGVDYELFVERLSNQETKVAVRDVSGTELIGTGLYEFAKDLPKLGNAPKEAIPPEKMTLDVSQNGYKLKIIFQNVNFENDVGVDYSLLVLFGD
jgi:hypothetical protein